MTTEATTDSNHRGYAYVALRNAHKRQLGWNQFAAAEKYGYYPNLYDYIEEGLAMFDRMYAIATPTDESVKEIMDTIVKEMGKSITESYRGHFRYPTDEEGRQYVTAGYDTVLDSIIGDDDGIPLTVGNTIAEEEVGYRQVEDVDVMRVRLRVLSERLREEDMNILIAYVNGEYDTLTEALGRRGAQAFRKRVRNAASGLKEMELFNAG